MVLFELESLSSRLGQNPMLVQGAGGNTSIKDKSTLWVKASGKRLADAEREPIFVAMDHARVLALISDDTEQDLSTCVLDPESGLRPSIEASIHALMPHRVVLHVHSIRAISWACKTNAMEIAERLDGLSWAFIPYHRPGIPLTKAIRQQTEGVIPSILILGNHGLIVAAESCTEAEKLLQEVELRLDIYERPSPMYDLPILEEIVASTPYRLPANRVAHDLATDDLNFQIATQGSLYPDHVVFLGQGVVGITSQTDLVEILRAESLPPLLLIKSIGALVLETLSENAEEMVLALALVAKRIHTSERLRYLSVDEEMALCNWDAEKFRQSVGSQHSAK